MTLYDLLILAEENNIGIRIERYRNMTLLCVNNSKNGKSKVVVFNNEELDATTTLAGTSKANRIFSDALKEITMEDTDNGKR